MVTPLPLPYKLLSSGSSRLLVSVPHAGRRYDWLAQAAQRPTASLPVLRRGEDPYVDYLAMPLARTGLPTLIQCAPRAIIDVNRAPLEMAQEAFRAEDQDRTAFEESPKARQGLGVVPTRLGAEPLYSAPLRYRDLEQRRKRYYAPYHSAVEAVIASSRRHFDQVLLLDLHSMPRLRAQPFAAPHFVLGNRHDASCPAWLLESAADSLRAQGYSVVCNQPYAGGYIAERHADLERGRFVLQIEVCRSLYLTPQAQRSLTAAKPSQGRRKRSLAPRGCAVLQQVLLDLAQRLNAGLANSARRSKAAE